MQRASFICRLNFLLLGKGQSIYTGAHQTCVWREHKCTHQQQSRLSKKMAAGRCFGGDLGEAGKECWGDPWGFGEAVRGRGSSLADGWSTLLLECLGLCAQSNKAVVGAAGRVLVHTTLGHRVCHTESGWLVTCINLFGVLPLLSPWDMVASGEDRLAMLSAFPQWSQVCCLSLRAARALLSPLPAAHTGRWCFSASLQAPCSPGRASCSSHFAARSVLGFHSACLGND